jgi:hypothetical protein
MKVPFVAIEVPGKGGAIRENEFASDVPPMTI